MQAQTTRYDYNRLGSWENSYQQINTSNYYDAQKHAFLQTGTQGWFQWNYRIFGDDGALGNPNLTRPVPFGTGNRFVSAVWRHGL